MKIRGNRTYITVGVIAAVQIARAFDLITSEMAETATNLLLGGGLAFLRAGVKNVIWLPRPILRAGGEPSSAWLAR